MSDEDQPGRADDDALQRLRAELAGIDELAVVARAERFEAINAALTDELARLDEI